MNLSSLTPEQRKALAQEALEAEKAEQRQKEADRQAYKDLVSEKVEQIFPLLEEISTKLLNKNNRYIMNFTLLWK